MERTRTNIFVYASNTTTFTIQNQMQFNPNGNNWIVLSEPSQFFGDYEPWTGLVGAWTLSGTPTSSLSFENLLVAVTNAAGDSAHYGGFPQRTQTTTKSYWAWYTYDCNFGWCHADFSQTSTKTFTVPLPTAITNEAGYITTLFYDSNNRLIGIRGPSGLTTTNRYDSSGFLTNTVAIEISATNNFTYTNGLVFTHKGPLGLITTNLWDKLQRLQASYDSEGYISNVYTRLDLTAIKDKLGNWSYFSYDPLRRPIAFTNANQEITLAQYCQCGSLDWVRDPLQKYTYFYYDLAGRLTNVVHPDGYSVTNLFNSLDQLVCTSDSRGATTNFYNLQGLLTLAQNAGGTVRSNKYDLLDRPTAILAPSGVANYLTYDSLGRILTNVVSDKLTNSFAYSTNGLIRLTDGLGKSTQFSNDVAGHVLFCTNANNEITQYKYDSAGNVTNLVDGKVQKTSFQYDQFSRLTNKLDNASASMLQLTYDANGRLKTKTTPAKGATSYIYDTVGRVRTNSYAHDPQVVFTYDARGRLTNMVDSVGTTAFAYSDGGQIVKMVRGPAIRFPTPTTDGSAALCRLQCRMVRPGRRPINTMVPAV